MAMKMMPPMKVKWTTSIRPSAPSTRWRIQDGVESETSMKLFQTGPQAFILEFERRKSWVPRSVPICRWVGSS
jgi:hypothetical protein